VAVNEFFGALFCIVVIFTMQLDCSEDVAVVANDVNATTLLQMQRSVRKSLLSIYPPRAYPKRPSPFARHSL
jgi:hypothetical protein